MLTFSTPQLRQIVKDSDPSNEQLKAVDHIDFLEFNELEQSVKEDVSYLKEHPLLLPETIISGWVYDVGTGKVRSVADWGGLLLNALLCRYVKSYSRMSESVDTFQHTTRPERCEVPDPHILAMLMLSDCSLRTSTPIQCLFVCKSSLCFM